MFYCSVCFLPTASAKNNNPQIASAFCPFNVKKAKSFFSREFLHDNTAKDIQEIFQSQVELYGPCKKIKAVGKVYKMEYENALMNLEPSYNEQGKISNFEFTEITYTNDSLEKIAQFSKEKFPNSSIFVAKNGKELFSYEPDKTLNISRASNLIVLRAVNEALAEKKITPQETTPLDPLSKSLEFSMLHNWIEGTQLSIDTLKNMMMIEADPIAADLLILKLGRTSIERYGKNLKPFLTNREQSLLYLQNNLNGLSREKIAQLAQNLRKDSTPFPENRFDIIPVVGWFATTKELCENAYALKDEPIWFASQVSKGEKMRLEAEDDQIVAAIEPRDPGIANTTILWKSNENTFCLSLSVNQNKPISEPLLSAISARIYSLFSKI